MTRFSTTLAVAVAAMAFDAPASAACAGAQQTPATSSRVAAMAAVAGPGRRVALQQAIARR